MCEQYKRFDNSLGDDPLIFGDDPLIIGDHP